MDATSLAAAFASRLGELSLAAELATKTILGLDSVADDRLVAEITNRLGIFCYSFLHYDRAASQMQASLAAAERAGDSYQAHRQLLNIADALLLAVRAGRATGAAPRTPPYPKDQDRLEERAGQVLQRALAEVAPVAHFSLVGHRLYAELLLELGQPAEALQVVTTASGARPCPMLKRPLSPWSNRAA